MCGGNNLFAAQKNIYELIAKKVDGSIRTTFQIYSTSEYDARNELALNGWEIISIRKISTDSDEELSQKVKKLNQLSVKSKKIKKKQMNNEQKMTGVMADMLPIENNSEMMTSDTLMLSNMNDEEEILDIPGVSESKSYVLVTYFDFAKESSVLNEDIVGHIKGLDNQLSYIIYGHTDSVPVKVGNGRYKNNHDLSLKRANFIKDKMIQLANIPVENILIVGMGERAPAESNLVAGQPKNRRVEVYRRGL